jgi:hypothetical protein
MFTSTFRYDTVEVENRLYTRPGRIAQIAQTGLKSSLSLDRTNYLQTGMNSE